MTINEERANKKRANRHIFTFVFRFAKKKLICEVKNFIVVSIATQFIQYSLKTSSLYYPKINRA